MKTLGQQKRTFSAILYLIISFIVFALLFILLYMPTLMPRATIAGYSLAAYNGEVSSDKLKSGALAVVAVHDAENPESILSGDNFIFFIERTTVDNKKIYTVDARKMNEYTLSSDGKYYEVFNVNIDETGYYYDEIFVQNMGGKVVFSIPFLGAASAILNKELIATIASLLFLAIILISVPIVVMIVVIRAKLKPSSFPNGIDKRKFKKQDEYIYSELIKFFKAGKMRVVRGFDCDQIYMNKNIYFANIAYINKAIYVNINKDFRRYDNRLDRSGAILVAHPSELPYAKERILTIYKSYFARYKRPTNMY